MNILVIAPHPDDDILGCGGTIKKHIAEGDNLSVCIVTKGFSPIFTDDSVRTVRKEHKQALHRLGIEHIEYLDFPAVMLEEQHRYEINRSFDNVIRKYKPETVYIPHFGDMQKDHAIVSEAVMVAVRPRGNYTVKTVLAYETLSETEWNIPHSSKTFIPNYYVYISDYLKDKLEALKLIKSQISDFPAPRSLEAVESLAKLRGSTVGVKAAEAFSVVRIIKTNNVKKTGSTTNNPDIATITNK